MARYFEGQRVLVTGASSGIGRALAERVAAEGGDLVLVSRRESILRAQAEELTSRYGVKADFVQADLATAGAASDVAKVLSERGISVDVLVNNAGLGVHGDLGQASLVDVSEQIAVNITALTELTTVLLPPMIARGRGTILNVASTAAYQPVPHMAVYAATKAYVLSFSRALWSETRGSGIRVLVVSPGATDTAFFDVAGEAASVGDRRSPDQVVEVAMKALRAGRREVVDGAGNRLLARLASRMPSSLAIALAERSVRPQSAATN